MTDFLHPEGLCFDLGANVGIFTAAMAQLVGSGGMVIAVEPNPAVIAQLSDTVRCRFPGQVRAVQAGIAGEEGVGSLQIGGFSESVEVSRAEEPASNDVRLVTVDGLIERFGIPSFIKVDIEGAEADLLGSMDRSLANGIRPFLLIEFHPEKIRRRGGDAETIREQLREIGYDERWVERVGSAYRLRVDPSRPLGHDNVLFVDPKQLAMRPNLLVHWH